MDSSCSFMPTKTLKPMLPLAASSLMIGALAHSNWALLYAAMLFGFAVFVGYLWPKHVMVWTLVLALGSPIVNVAAHLFLSYRPGVPMVEDVFRHFAGALLGILPGLGAGATWRHLHKKLRERRAQASMTA